MRTVIAIVAAAAFAASLPAPTHAVIVKRGTWDIGREASCKWRAKKKYSVAHYLRRRAFIRDCMNERN